MLDKLLRITPERIQWFHNGHWVPMPHRYFLWNNVEQHFQTNKKRMPKHQQKVWEDLYRRTLLQGNILHINHLAFKVRNIHVQLPIKVA